MKVSVFHERAYFGEFFWDPTWVLKPARVTQRLSDTNTSGAINRAPTPEGFVRLLSIASILSIVSIASIASILSILSIRGKHLRPPVLNPVSSLAFPRHSSLRHG
ncbi:MAG: hypothetical protein GX117_04010 [Candidatus Hydrogenedentes bacterium]|nr:hypothetical protein [Candidatus Hydrogenedentota bacterium]